MRAVYGYGFSVGQDTNILPIRFLIPKGWPAMGLAFDEEIIHRSTNGCREEDFSSVGVAKFNLGGFLALGEKLGLSLVVSAVFGVVSIVVANVAL